MTVNASGRFRGAAGTDGPEIRDPRPQGDALPGKILQESQYCFGKHRRIRLYYPWIIAGGAARLPGTPAHGRRADPTRTLAPPNEWDSN